MDCAKAMAYFAKGNYKLVAIPTTSGSGSEVTDFAILTHNKVKHPLVDKRLRPDAAILDSDLLQELPKGLIAETGFDALSHAVEAYAAKNAGAMTDLYAREAFSSAFAALPASYAGRKDVRLKVHQAATMAGIAFTQAGLGLCHAMAHQIGAAYNIPHGVANAIMLPSVMHFNRLVCRKRYPEIGLALSGRMMDAEETVRCVQQLIVELGLPANLVEAGARKEDFARFSVDALDDPCLSSNPRTASQAEIVDVFLHAYHRPGRESYR